MYNVLYLFNSGKLVIKSIVTVKNRYVWESVLIGVKEGANGCVLTFICWHSVYSYI